MHKPLVTVVTVTYNLIKNGRREKFARALESVQSQTYENIEHIIVDGASNDGTVELIKEYAEKGWIKYISEPDIGLYDAMNKGAKMANGEYLLFLNSDDYYSGKEGIEKSVDAIEKADADYSYSDCKIIDFDGIKTADWHWQNKPKLSKVFTYMPFCHQTLMVKTKLFKQLGMFDLQYKSAGDYDFVLRLIFNKSKSVYVPYEFVTFELGGYSLESKYKAITEITKFYQKHYGEFCKLSIKDCEKIYESKHIPLKLLIKLLKYIDKSYAKELILDKDYYKMVFKNFRKRIIKIRFSKQNPAFELFGVKII